MSAVAAAFLMAHGLIHLAIWLPQPSAASPFDPRHSWRVHDHGLATGTAVALACAVAAVDATAGVSLALGTSGFASLAILGALLGLVLKALFFNPWLVLGVVIDVAVVVVALD